MNSDRLPFFRSKLCEFCSAKRTSTGTKFFINLLGSLHANATSTAFNFLLLATPHIDIYNSTYKVSTPHIGIYKDSNWTFDHRYPD